MMEHSPDEILVAHLIAAGKCTDTTKNRPWPGFYSAMPDAPDNLVVVYGTAGRTDGRLHTDGHTIEHPGIQIRVRGTDHRVAHVRARLLADHLDTIKMAPVAIGTKTYTIQAVTRTGPVLDMGMEEGKRRSHFSVNAIATIREEPGS